MSRHCWKQTVSRSEITFIRVITVIDTKFLAKIFHEKLGLIIKMSRHRWKQTESRTEITFINLFSPYN